MLEKNSYVGLYFFQYILCMVKVWYILKKTKIRENIQVADKSIFVLVFKIKNIKKDFSYLSDFFSVSYT